MLRFNCGHIKVAGFMMPIDVLEDQGLANYELDESPTYSWAERHAEFRQRQKLRSYEDFMAHEETRSGKSRYTPIIKSSMQITRRTEN